MLQRLDFAISWIQRIIPNLYWTAGLVPSPFYLRIMKQYQKLESLVREIHPLTLLPRFNKSMKDSGVVGCDGTWSTSVGISNPELTGRLELPSMVAAIVSGFSGENPGIEAWRLACEGPLLRVSVWESVNPKTSSGLSSGTVFCPALPISVSIPVPKSFSCSPEVKAASDKYNSNVAFERV